MLGRKNAQGKKVGKSKSQKNQHKRAASIGRTAITWLRRPPWPWDQQTNEKEELMRTQIGADGGRGEPAHLAEQCWITCYITCLVKFKINSILYFLLRTTTTILEWTFGTSEISEIYWKLSQYLRILRERKKKRVDASDPPRSSEPWFPGSSFKAMYK